MLFRWLEKDCNEANVIFPWLFQPGKHLGVGFAPLDQCDARCGVGFSRELCHQSRLGRKKRGIRISLHLDKHRFVQCDARYAPPLVQDGVELICKFTRQSQIEQVMMVGLAANLGSRACDDRFLGGDAARYPLSKLMPSRGRDNHAQSRSLGRFERVKAALRHLLI